MSKKILIISHDKIGASMAGPGIRYHYMANVLSKHFDVTVGFFNSNYLPEDGFSKNYETVILTEKNFKNHFSRFNTIIAMWLNEEMLKFCKKAGIFLVFDIYAPVPVENLTLFLYGGDKIDQNTDYLYKQSYVLYKKYFQYGDLFMFSNRRQLDFWIGYVFGTGIIKVSTYQKRELFDRFIYAPMGIDTETALPKNKDLFSKTINGINKKDKILLWTGGIWNWFDAQTLIRAMSIVKDRDPSIKLVFFGLKHPNPNIPIMQEAHSAISLAKKLGLYNINIFIKDDWVPYEERLKYLTSASAAVNTTKESIESEFSHRTRVLDHILTELPTISTSGDYLSDEVISPQNLGITVPANDKQLLADAILEIVESKNNIKIRNNIKNAKDDFDWNTSLASLIYGIKKYNKLEFIENEHSVNLRKDSGVFKIGKKIIPKPIKKVIIKVFRYGQ